MRFSRPGKKNANEVADGEREGEGEKDAGDRFEMDSRGGTLPMKLTTGEIRVQQREKTQRDKQVECKEQCDILLVSVLSARLFSMQSPIVQCEATGCHRSFMKCFRESLAYLAVLSRLHRKEQFPKNMAQKSSQPDAPHCKSISNDTIRWTRQRDCSRSARFTGRASHRILIRASRLPHEVA